MSSQHRPGPHELGQNFLTDRRVIAEITRLVARTDGPIVEIGPGDGALTIPLARLGRRITAVEVDRRRAARLAAATPSRVVVERRDILSFELPRTPYVVVANVPFHLTTKVLRKLLNAGWWTDAVLLVQWEVARRRAGVGGATLLTASWWPWYDFDLVRRVPARAFRPAPSVDGGLLRITRRQEPLVSDRRGYQRFVQQVFTGPGRGLPDVVRRTRLVGRRDLDAWVVRHRLNGRTLPKDLTAAQWASLWALTRPSAGPRRRVVRA